MPDPTPLPRTSAEETDRETSLETDLETGTRREIDRTRAEVGADAAIDVGETGKELEPGGIVAGFDGTADGVEVVVWALAEAAAHGEPLHVVRAWTIVQALPHAGTPFGVVPSLRECQDGIERTLRLAVADARRAGEHPGVPVVVHAVAGAAAPALAALSRQARLLVVGHRGRGVLPLILGSVTEHVLASATCPVAVVPLRRP